MENSEETRHLLMPDVLADHFDPIPTEGGSDEEARPTYRVYKARWYILFVLALLNLSNGMLWISFSPIADVTADYYGVDAMQVNWLAIIFMAISIPIGFFATWFLHITGLRASIILSSWFNVIGAVLRVVSSVGVPSRWRYPLVLSGQAMSAVAQPLIMFVPTKVAALWFAADQRAIANTLATVANAAGVMICNLVSPAVVKHAKDVPLLNWICLVPAGVCVCLATCGVCKSVPDTPPTASAAEPPEPFNTGIKKILRNRSYWLLALAFGMGVALFTAVSTLMEQLLCTQGYSDTFAGWCSGLMIAVGLVGAACGAVYVDKTKQFEEVAKCGLGLSLVSLIGFLVLSRYPDKHAFLIILISSTGFFGFASNPLSLELSVECTFPVAEATSAGLLISSGQIQSFLLVLVMQALARPYGVSEILHQTCYSVGEHGVATLDYTVANLCASSYGTFILVLFVLFFRCEYKRMKSEQNQAAANILLNSERQQIVT